MVTRPMYKRIMYLKRKKRKVHKFSLHPSKDTNTPPIKKSYANSPPKYITTLIPKTTPPLLSRMTKGKSLRSGHFLIIGRTIILILIIIIITGAIITSSSEARGDGKGGAMKPPRQA